MKVNGLELKEEGCIIDGEYLINVKSIMEEIELPEPRKRLRDIDGSILPLISIDTGGYQ